MNHRQHKFATSVTSNEREEKAKIWVESTGGYLDVSYHDLAIRLNWGGAAPGRAGVGQDHVLPTESAFYYVCKPLLFIRRWHA